MCVHLLASILRRNVSISTSIVYFLSPIRVSGASYSWSKISWSFTIGSRSFSSLRGIGGSSAKAVVIPGQEAASSGLLQYDVTVFVRKEGDKSDATLIVKSDTLIGLLKEEIREKLCMTERLSTLMLHVFNVGGVGKVMGGNLESDATLGEVLAGKGNTIHLVIKESDPIRMPSSLAAPASSKLILFFLFFYCIW